MNPKRTSYVCLLVLALVIGVGGIARGLLLAANALDTPILSIHQLNRGVDARPDKRPMLSDLRESGQLEEHADVVLMLYREGYYDNGNGGVDNENERANVMEVWSRKNRLDLPASRGQAGGPSGERCELFWRGGDDAMLRDGKRGCEVESACARARG